MTMKYMNTVQLEVTGVVAFPLYADENWVNLQTSKHKNKNSGFLTKTPWDIRCFKLEKQDYFQPFSKISSYRFR